MIVFNVFGKQLGMRFLHCFLIIHRVRYYREAKQKKELRLQKNESELFVTICKYVIIYNIVWALQLCDIMCWHLLLMIDGVTFYRSVLSLTAILTL